MRSLIFIGIYGCAVALDRATGQEVWRTDLKGSDFVTVAQSGGDVLAGSRGRLYCLDASTGYVRWENELKGLGFGLVSIAGADATGAAETGRRRAAAAEAAATSSAG